MKEGERVLQLEIPEREFYDEISSSIIVTKKESLQLEHSLVSLSKWESKLCKPFLSKDHKTTEETIEYIKCMTITQNIKPEVYFNLSNEAFNQIEEYINLPMTATWFNDNPNAQKRREVITAEVIYYWMITHNVPMECQKWHLNRLLTLIKVCNIKNQPPTKQGRKEILSNRAALNQARRSQYKTKG
jgi:hypothetical protein